MKKSVLSIVFSKFVNTFEFFKHVLVQTLEAVCVWMFSRFLRVSKRWWGCRKDSPCSAWSYSNRLHQLKDVPYRVFEIIYSNVVFGHWKKWIDFLVVVDRHQQGM